jgi:hypothetical protein
MPRHRNSTIARMTATTAVATERFAARHDPVRLRAVLRSLPRHSLPSHLRQRLLAIPDSETAACAPPTLEHR